MSNAEILRSERALRGIEEECHTYDRWKRMGYQVRRGSKALFACMIWKCVTKTDAESGEQSSRMFMHKAWFFGRSQVDAIQLSA